MSSQHRMTTAVQAECHSLSVWPSLSSLSHLLPPSLEHVSTPACISILAIVSLAVKWNPARQRCKQTLTTKFLNAYIFRCKSELLLGIVMAAVAAVAFHLLGSSAELLIVITIAALQHAGQNCNLSSSYVLATSTQV